MRDLGRDSGRDATFPADSVPGLKRGPLAAVIEDGFAGALPFARVVGYAA
jgi:hypothetical protein